MQKWDFLAGDQSNPRSPRAKISRITGSARHAIRLALTRLTDLPDLLTQKNLLPLRKRSNLMNRTFIHDMKEQFFTNFACLFD